MTSSKMSISDAGLTKIFNRPPLIANRYLEATLPSGDKELLTCPFAMLLKLSGLPHKMHSPAVESMQLLKVLECNSMGLTKIIDECKDGIWQPTILEKWLIEHDTRQRSVRGILDDRYTKPSSNGTINAAIEIVKASGEPVGGNESLEGEYTVNHDPACPPAERINRVRNEMADDYYNIFGVMRKRPVGARKNKRKFGYSSGKGVVDRKTKEPLKFLNRGTNKLHKRETIRAVENDSTSSDESDVNDESEVIRAVQKKRKQLQRAHQKSQKKGRGKSDKVRFADAQKKPSVCFSCHKPGHMVMDCPDTAAKEKWLRERANGTHKYPDDKISRIIEGKEGSDEDRYWFSECYLKANENGDFNLDGQTFNINKLIDNENHGEATIDSSDSEDEEQIDKVIDTPTQVEVEEDSAEAVHHGLMSNLTVLHDTHTERGLREIFSFVLIDMNTTRRWHFLLFDLPMLVCYSSMR